MRHPAVAMAAVVGVPDPSRTEVVKAFLVLKHAIESSDTIAAEIQQFLKLRLAAHEYPRQVTFVDYLQLQRLAKSFVGLCGGLLRR